MKILLPVDGSLCSLSAAREVAQRPWPKGSWVKILHVAERPLIDPQAAQTLPEEVDRFLLGGVSGAEAACAGCSVEVARPRE